MITDSAERTMLGKATIIDDDHAFSTAVSLVLEAANISVDSYASAEEFLDVVVEPPEGCLIVDLQLGETSGLGLLKTLRKRGWTVPAVVASGTVTVPDAMDAVEYGVVDVIQKPVAANRLHEVVKKAIAIGQPTINRGVLRQRYEELTDKERQVLRFTLEGRMNKSIAIRMDSGLRSVVRYKQNVLDKLGFRETADLIREWARLEMDLPRIETGDASAALPHRVREEIRLKIDDIAMRLASLSQTEAFSKVGLQSIAHDLAGLTQAEGLLSPGEVLGHPRERPYVALLSDRPQESKLLARILRLHQFFPDICENGPQVLESLACAEDDGLPAFVVFNGDESVQKVNHLFGERYGFRMIRQLGVLTISSASSLDMSDAPNGLKHCHLKHPFDPQDVIAEILEGVAATATKN